ncbi:FkbM family methyltransferase [Phormidium sp. FACHB-1136]|uniref:FkbM family methyltransferase n=1 Tax=Phormidium sp. FACHB-1136 TaxID=2692848 RepID=UPI001685A683|nr:FkbM family methyltransferase [Phormidium sp. FACHB-1136]MBD2425307.1 FkbM family methyltransferase [Phormidium sp. FACHB-1136]
MRVEACCQALLHHLLPEIDPQRQGVCFDVGVGTFAFYCDLFRQLGFATVAVEPLPTEKLKRRCQQQGITLLELCLSDQVGQQTLHLGQFANIGNRNFSSLSADWFGSSEHTQVVETLDLATLLTQTETKAITVLKLDIEGWEPVVIQQLASLAPDCLPALVMFEYGGGGSYEKGTQGWASPFLAGTLDSLKLLQRLGYQTSIMVDYAPGSEAKVFDLQALDLETETPFFANGVYGNILSFRHHQPSRDHIQRLCAPYRGGLVNWLVGNLVLATAK